LLKLAQLEAQPQLMQKEAICVLEICQELKIEHHERLSNKSIDFQINGDAETYIQGEASMLKAAIANLLENAIHFSPDHSVITCSIQNNGSQTLIAMKDEGTGVPDYAINRVFERFYSLAKPIAYQSDLNRWQVIIQLAPNGSLVSKQSLNVNLVLACMCQRLMACGLLLFLLWFYSMRISTSLLIR